MKSRAMVTWGVVVVLMTVMVMSQARADRVSVGLGIGGSGGFLAVGVNSGRECAPLIHDTSPHLRPVRYRLVCRQVQYAPVCRQAHYAPVVVVRHPQRHLREERVWMGGSRRAGVDAWGRSAHVRQYDHRGTRRTMVRRR